MVGPSVSKTTKEEIIEDLEWDKQDAYRTMGKNHEIVQTLLMDWIIPLMDRVDKLEKVEVKE